MKAITAAVLMIAVSAWGQAPADSWPDKFAPFCMDGSHVTARDANGTVLRCAKDAPKPHKPKPSVETFKNTITPQLARELAEQPDKAAVPVEPQWTCTVTLNDIHCTKGDSGAK